jgi:hypothetical protein
MSEKMSEMSELKEKLEEKMFRQAYPFRSTRMGGRTIVIAVCPLCKKILEPSRVRRSRTGTHGEDYYVHRHPIESVWLKQSNSGIRTITVPPSLEPIRDLLERTWIYEDSCADDVVNVIRAYFMTKRD